MRFNNSLRNSVKQIFRSLFPEFRRQLYFPIKGRVKKVYTAAGKYCCDVEPLKNNEESWTTPAPDGTEKVAQVIKEVAIDSVSNGPARGIFALPAVDSIVRVSFYDGDPNFPFIDAVLPGATTPALDTTEVAIYQGENFSIRMRASGALAITAPGDVTVTAGGNLVATSKKATINADEVNLAGVGGKGVVCVGHTCNFTGTHPKGSTKVKSI